MITRFTFYKGADNQWRWKGKRSGDFTANGGQGYSRRIDAVTAVVHMMESEYQLIVQKKPKRKRAR